jgi:YVTN family beta-propeller protein
VIDGDNKIVSRVIDVSSTPNIDAPHMVKVKDGFLYATLISDGKFLKINTSDYQTAGEVSGLDFPGMIMLTNDGTKAYVSRSSSAPGSYSTIYVINIQQMSLIKEIVLPVSGIPHGIVLSPDNSKLYVANLTKNRISIVNTQTDEFVEDILLSATEDHEPMQTNISPDGQYLYVSARGTGRLLVVDTGTNSLIEEVPVGMMPMHIAVSSSGEKIYVPSMMGNFVSTVVKSGNTWTKTGEITHPAFSMLHGADLTADDKYLFVSSRNLNGNFEPAYKVNGEGLTATVGIINTENGQVEKILEIEEYGAGLTVEK